MINNNFRSLNSKSVNNIKCAICNTDFFFILVCVQISSPAGTRYYSCRSAEERDKWVESLRRAVYPQSDTKSRVHNSVKVTIVEAKGIAPKKK